MRTASSGLLDDQENWGSVPLWAPQPGPQTDAITAKWCPEVFYGGAAGGGKSDFLLGDFLQDVPTYEAAWRGVLFRRTYPELEELVARSKEMYPQTGASWNDQKKVWTWPNGANLKMRYAERNDDVLRYQGHQYTWVGWDELTQWPTLFCYRYLRSRLRSAHAVPTKRIRAAANPGGPGHLEVKRYFVDPAPMGYVPLLDQATGMERMFIPARLKDNFLLLKNDPMYRGRLAGLGSDTLVKALLEGDWSVVEGAFFDCWSASRHIVRPFKVPEHWLRFRSMDWGFASPFSVGWWAIVGDTFAAENIVGDEVVLPRGCMVRYREWYGRASDGAGLRLTAEEVGRGIVERDLKESITYGVLDPSAFKEDGGPSIAERMFSATNGRANFRHADNTRVGPRGAMGGWDQVRARLKGDLDGHPMMVVFSTCADLIRTLPVLQHDKDKPEDLDTQSEDHAADEVRYGAMSRPWTQPKPRERNATVETRQPTIKEILAEHDRMTRQSGNRI